MQQDGNSRKMSIAPARVWVLGPALFVIAVLTAGTPSSHDPIESVVPDTTITVHTYGAELAFDPDRITVKAGTTVRIRYINESPLSHNLVVVREEDDIDVLGVAALDARKTEYIPQQHKERILGHSPLAATGRTVEFTFTAPPAGDYFFVCLVDGHYNMMVGTLRSIP
jgi:plastocyanin